MSGIQGDTVQANGAAKIQSTSHEELRALVERKDRFIAVAGHELRNVLAPVVTSLDVLMETPADETQAELIKIAAQNAKQLARLVDDLFDASRLASGKVKLCQETIDARGIAEQTIRTLTPAIRVCRQQLLVTRCNEPLWLNADPLRLEQVFLNLLSNAIKYTPEGGCIWFKQHRENNSAVFQVRDSGCGIRSELLPYIFDFFAQADDGDGHASSGLALGLAVAKSIVEMHGGKIDADSEGPGCGADFTIRFPLHRN